MTREAGWRYGIISTVPYEQQCQSSTKVARNKCFFFFFLNEDLSRDSADIRKAKLPELKDLLKRCFITYFRGKEIVHVKRSTKGRIPLGVLAVELRINCYQEIISKLHVGRGVMVRPANLLLSGAQTRTPTVRTREEDLISFLTFQFNNSNVYLAEYLPFYVTDNELQKEIYSDDCSYFYNNYDRLYFNPFGDSDKFDWSIRSGYSI